MTEALHLLADLNQEDADWLLAQGIEQQIPSGAIVIREGVLPDALYFVLEGLIGIGTDAAGDKHLGQLGPGEIVGDISFLEGCVAAATVSAVESSLLLAIDVGKIHRKCDEDSWFAARLFRSFARLASRRLRERLGTAGHLLRDQASVDEALAGPFAVLSGPLDEFKRLLHEADQSAIKSDGEIPADLATRIHCGFLDFCDLLNREIGDAAPHPQVVKDELGARVKREVLPYMLLTQTGERYYSKPRGYAGDFMTIDLMYRDTPAGTGRVGPLLDRCFLDVAAAKAVRNRRGLLVEEILRVVEARGPDEAQVTTLACGPAQEIFDVFARLSDPLRLSANLLDIDLQALAFVDDKRGALKLKRRIRLVNANLVYLALGKQQLDVGPQDLVYSIGLIDYFNDKFVIGLLDFVYDVLRPGGKVILGNFHPRNRTKALMDHVLDWKLIHRTEEDMDRLFSFSRFGSKSTDVRFEQEGVNMFAACVRQS